MRKHYAIILLSALIFACTDDSDKLMPDSNDTTISQITKSVEYPADDGSIDLQTTYPWKTREMVRDILKAMVPDKAKTLFHIEITDEEYAEIATFTDNLVKDCKDESETYKKIFAYVHDSTEYVTDGYVDNNPYQVFKEHRAICQGYSNLMSVMLHSQEIPCLVVNGLLQGLGHAWNYVYYNNKWWVSDPTNDGSYLMDLPASYTHLMPTIIMATIFEDENFCYNFYESHLNVKKIKSNADQVIIPYSVAGFTITALNPYFESWHDEPSNVKELYIGKNIMTLGEDIIGLRTYAPRLSSINIDPENTNIESYSNVVYRYDSPYFIPKGVTTIELKPMESVGKEILKELENLETVIFPEGTKYIGPWAIEKCPNVKTIYVPAGIEIAENAFVGVHEDVKIIEGEYTSIPQIKM